MKLVIDIHEQLKINYGITSTEFSQSWLGMCPSYLSYLKSTKCEASPTALLNLYKEVIAEKQSYSELADSCFDIDQIVLYRSHERFFSLLEQKIHNDVLSC